MSVFQRLLDNSILLSFDRSGFRRHAARFEPADLDVDLSGRVALVTGASSGLGLSAARSLCALGARVHLLCRDLGRGRDAAHAIRAALAAVHGRRGEPDLHLQHVDIADMRSVRSFVGRLGEARVDILVHNAAVLPAARAETSDGLETTFATHVAGPFLLTALLRARLERSTDARLVFVSSGGMYTQKLSIDDWAWKQRAFDGVQAYAQTKRAQVVLAELWAERFAATRVTVSAMHPGWADTPGVRSSLPTFHRLMRARLRTPEEGADTIVWLAACPHLRGRSGLFWFDRAPAATHRVPWTEEAAHTRRKLWRLCVRLTDAAQALAVPAPRRPARR
jgi:NAD(P)-dependent dehydrogenase (short-subunit alcohol dehydrogenase family)